MSPDEKPLNTETEEKSPAQIREEIEETRTEMGETVEALAAKTDVKAQAKAKVEGVKAQTKAKVEDVKAQAKVAAPESPQEGADQARALVEQNPKPLAVAGALVALFVLWRLLRS